MRSRNLKNVDIKICVDIKNSCRHKIHVDIKIEEIKQYLPQRYPMLFLDRVTELELGKYVKGYKSFKTRFQI